MSAPALPNPGKVSDADLLAMIHVGSADALTELYERYSIRAFRVARSICNDHGDAEDAVQEAFVSIFTRSITSRLQRGTVGAWVLTVVLNKAIDVSRDDRALGTRRGSTAGLPVPTRPDYAADQAAAHRETSRGRAALASLPGSQRDVIALAFYGELSHTEIAERLGVPSETVKSRMRTGLHNLCADI